MFWNDKQICEHYCIEFHSFKSKLITILFNMFSKTRLASIFDLPPCLYNIDEGIIVLVLDGKTAR